MKDELLRLKEENDMLKKQNERLISELEECHKDINKQISVLRSVKAEIRRQQVQLDALKVQNAELKYRFDRIENHPIGKILFKIYRNLRELKHRFSDRKTG